MSSKQVKPRSPKTATENYENRAWPGRPFRVESECESEIQSGSGNGELQAPTTKESISEQRLKMNFSTVSYKSDHWETCMIIKENLEQAGYTVWMEVE